MYILLLLVPAKHTTTTTTTTTTATTITTATTATTIDYRHNENNRRDMNKTGTCMNTYIHTLLYNNMHTINNPICILHCQSLRYIYFFNIRQVSVSYTHLRAHETPEHLVCRLLLEKKK